VIHFGKPHGKVGAEKAWIGVTAMRRHSVALQVAVKTGYADKG